MSMCPRCGLAKCYNEYQLHNTAYYIYKSYSAAYLLYTDYSVNVE